MVLLSWKFLSLGHGLMAILLALAIVGTVLTIERLLFFKRYDVDAAIFIDGIRNLIAFDKIEEAIDLCEREGSPIANVIRIALLDRDLPPAEIKTHIKSAALLEIPRCEQHILPIRTVAKISPMLGLMGVVFSFYMAFKTLQDLGLSYTSSDIFSEEITSAMLLIIASLATSVFANLAYNFLYGKVQSMIYQLEWTYNEALQIVFSKR